jgi:hypothetical protein
MMIPMVLALSMVLSDGSEPAGDARPRLETAAAELPGYRIGPEDVLQISVWGNDAVRPSAPTAGSRFRCSTTCKPPA